MSDIIIIPAAGKGIMADAQQPILTVRFLDGEYLYEKQITAIRKVIPNAKIIYITGFCTEKIDTRLKILDCEIIHNDDFNKTSSAHSIYLAAKNMNKSAYILYGNLFFDKNTIKSIKSYNIDFNNSIIFTGDNSDTKSLGVGPNGQFDWVFEKKWAKMCYLSSADLEIYCKICEKLGKQRLLFEIFNELVCTTYMKYHQINSFFHEIHRVRDVKKINRILNDGQAKVSIN